MITIRYTAPINCLFWKRHEMKNLGEKLVKLLLELNFENHPIIVHLFSNGGAFLYQHLSMALKKTEKPVQVNYKKRHLGWICIFINFCPSI